LDRQGPATIGRLPVSEQNQALASYLDSSVTPGSLTSGLPPSALDCAAYGTHTMHRTKATLIYRRTKNLRAVQLLLGHTRLESTVRYLGIEVDGALEIAEQTEIEANRDRRRPSRRSLSGQEWTLDRTLCLGAETWIRFPTHLTPQILRVRNVTSTLWCSRVGTVTCLTKQSDARILVLSR
jgi:hypothetical protein